MDDGTRPQAGILFSKRGHAPSWRERCTAACLALLAACSPGPAPPPDVLRIALEAAPTQIDPRYATDAHSSRIGSLLFASLTRPAADGGREPYLAARWTQPDARSYVFELRRGFRFHDGSPVTAEDIAATYRSVLDPAMASPKRGGLPAITSVDVPDPERLVFRLAEPDSSFLDATGLGVLPASLARRRELAASELGGSGPYRLEAIDEDSVELRAYAGFAEGPPAIAGIRFRVLPDGVMRALELHHGTIDFVQNALEPETTAWLAASDRNVQILDGPYDACQYLGMNLTHPALADRRVRRAIAYAIDREAIVDHVLEGGAALASGLLPTHHWAYRAQVRRYGHDPARARALLDAAGWTDPDGDGPAPRMTLSYKTSTVELRRAIAEVLAAQLAEVGIELEIRSYEWGTFFADIRAGNFHLYSLAWIGIRDPDLYRMILHSSMVPPQGSNRGGYRDPRIDRLTQRARRAPAGERARLYARVQVRAARTLPFVPLWWPRNVIVATRRLEGFVPNPSGELFELARARLR